MTDLRSSYLGFELKNPLIASASPISENVDKVKALEDAGISAVVMYSLFEEQIIHESHEIDHFLSQGTETYAEALSYLPDTGRYATKAEKYIDKIALLKSSVGIPIIGSLNGVSTGGWIEYAHKIEQAGADALELNIYFVPTDIDLTAQQLEDNFVSLVKNVSDQLTIPLAIKLSPYFSSTPNMCARLVEAGADGLVLFNRFYQPNIDLESLTISHEIQLSTSADLLLALRWIAILNERVEVDLALTGGIHTHQDVLKAMMVGSKAAMTASALLKFGTKWVTETLQSISFWMEENGYDSIKQMQGSMSQKEVAEPTAYERANYMKVLSSYKELP